MERATRLCAMSPQMATVSPASLPLARRMVNASSSACVGCSCVPSPAFTTPRAGVRGDVVRRARGCVADHQHVGVHRLEVLHGVEQRLALGDARARSRDVDDVGRQPLAGELERGARARRGLEEEVDDRLAAQRGHFADPPLRDLEEDLGGVEDADRVGGVEPLGAEQVLGGPHLAGRSVTAAPPG